MARILLGWELGANRGHVTMLAEIAHALHHEGHAIDAALQSLTGAAALFPKGTRLWQAPLWPRLLAGGKRPAGQAPATMGDILWRLGLGDAGAVEGLLRGWDAILEVAAPERIVANFAPALLLAARGRTPRLSVGTGFEQPPGAPDAFPSLTGAPAAHDEALALDGVNAALARLGRPLLDRLPALFDAEAAIVAGFEELDAYAARRTADRAAPAIGGAMPPLSEGSGDEVFVYAFETTMGESALWEGLARSGLAVRAHVPGASAALRARLGALGFAFESEPVSWDSIVARSRILVSHGGHGFVSAGLLAGLPQVVVHYDLEKMGYARALAALGIGGEAALHAIRPEPFAASLRVLHADEALAGRARAAAAGFRARMDRPLAVAVAKAMRAPAG